MSRTLIGFFLVFISTSAVADVWVCKGECSTRSSKSASEVLSPVEAAGETPADSFQMLLLSCPAVSGKIVGLIPDSTSPRSYFVRVGANSADFTDDSLRHFCRKQ